MSDVDSVLDSLMDDATGVSFVVVEGSARAARPPSPPRAVRIMGVGRSGMQGGGAFCMKRNCTFSSHGDAKTAFQGTEATCFFICRGGEVSTIIYAQPNIDERRVPLKIKEEWQTQQRTLAEWRMAFRAVENVDDVDASTDEIKKEVTFLEDTSNFRTPSRKRKEASSDGEGEALGNLDFVGHVRALPEDLTAELEDVITNTMAKGLLTRIVARLESSMVNQGAALETVAEMTYKRFLVNEQDLRAVSGAVQYIQTSVGQPVELDTRFEAPTLWSATSFVSEELVRVANGLSSLEGALEPMQKDLSVINGKFSQFVKMGQVVDKMLKVIVMMSGKVKEASSEIIGLKVKIESMESELSTSRNSSRDKRPNISGSSKVEMDELMDMFGTSHVAGGSLSDDIGVLKAVSEDKSVKFAGLGWRTILDCQLWIKSNFPSNRYGLIMDPLLMLDRVFGSDDVEADSQFKTLESRVKLKIATGAEAAAIKALYFKRPRLFHSGQVSMATDRHKSKLNKLPDHKVWKAGGEGVHNHIVMRLNLLHLTISQDIGHVLGHDPKGQLLATMCLNATVTFLTQMLAFVDSIYDKLVMASKFTAEQGWSLTMKILDRICEDLYAPKEGVVVAMNVEDPSSICAHVLWSCFRTHDIMATYMDVNFENHPAISAEYVKFLATNSGFEKVERLETTVASFKSLVDKASSDAAKAKSVADGSASAASSATKALAELVKRVGKLENK
ncbi:hypothetical protein MHU86_19778 [Fragilaria crotonensis]|nr:hypothetical protein MHU86_19778 [Fragilaria crotonensis]